MRHDETAYSAMKWKTALLLFLSRTLGRISENVNYKVVEGPQSTMEQRCAFKNVFFSWKPQNLKDVNSITDLIARKMYYNKTDTCTNKTTPCKHSIVTCYTKSSLCKPRLTTTASAIMHYALFQWSIHWA